MFDSDITLSDASLAEELALLEQKKHSDQKRMLWAGLFSCILLYSLDAIIDSFVFEKEEFLETLLFDVSAFELYFRGALVLVYLSTVFFYWRAQNRLYHTQAELIQAKHKAERISQFKSSFVSNMSHEIRTPLNGMLGMAQLLSMGNLEKDQEDMVETIINSGFSLVKVLNDILDLGRLEASKMEVHLGPLHLNELFDQISKLYIGSAQIQNTELVTGIDPKIPRELVGDDYLIKEILGNLVGNAIKFTQKGKIRLSAQHIKNDEATQTVRFEVSDTGIGINSEHLDHIFEAFRQADASTTRRFGGSGLGLTLCAEFAKLMGSKIEVYSQLDSGSRFWFDLTLSLPPSPNKLGA